MSATVFPVRGFLTIALHPLRLLGVLAGLAASMLYVWIAAVRAVPGVRRRKAGARAAWKRRERNYPG
ncbi:MAG: hypothetical protein R6W48_07670 [Gaiellaceae bacterium]